MNRARGQVLLFPTFTILSFNIIDGRVTEIVGKYGELNNLVIYNMSHKLWL